MLVTLHPENQRRAPLCERRSLFSGHEALRYFAPRKSETGTALRATFTKIKIMTRHQAYRIRIILERLSLWLIIIAIAICLVALVWSMFN